MIAGTHIIAIKPRIVIIQTYSFLALGRIGSFFVLLVFPTGNVVPVLLWRSYVVVLLLKNEVIKVLKTL